MRERHDGNTIRGVSTRLPSSSARRDVLRAGTVLLGSATATGCGLGGQSSTAVGTVAPAKVTKPATLLYWTILGGADGSRMRELTQQYVSETPLVQIEDIQGVPEFLTKFTASVVAGSPPDVVGIRQTYVPGFVQQNALYDLQPRELQQAGLRAEDFDPNVWKASEYQGKRYSIPLDVHGYMLFYHEATVRDGGLDPAKPPATLTDWLNWSTQLTRGDIHGASYSTNWWTFHHFLRQAGADIFSPDGQKAGFNNGAGVAAMTALSDLWQRNNHPLPVGALDLLEQRRLATLLNGPWNLNRLGQPSSPAFNDLRVAFAPQMNPAKPAWWAQSHQLALPKQQQVDEAKRTAAFNFVLWLTEHTLDWSQAGQLPANRKVLTSDGFQRSNHPVHQHLKVWERHLSSAAFMTLHPKYVDIESTLGPVLNRGMMRELSPQAALVDLEQAVNALLAQ